MTNAQNHGFCFEWIGLRTLPHRATFVPEKGVIRSLQEQENGHKIASKNIQKSSRNAKADNAPKNIPEAPKGNPNGGPAGRQDPLRTLPWGSETLPAMVGDKSQELTLRFIEIQKQVRKPKKSKSDQFHSDSLKFQEQSWAQTMTILDLYMDFKECYRMFQGFSWTA